MLRDSPLVIFNTVTILFVKNCIFYYYYYYWKTGDLFFFRISNWLNCPWGGSCSLPKVGQLRAVAKDSLVEAGSKRASFKGSSEETD